jgi:O-antigen ligase
MDLELHIGKQNQFANQKKQNVQNNKSMKYWIYAVVLGFVLFMAQDKDGISAIDIAAAVGYNFTLLLWFLVKILVRSEQTLYNTSPTKHKHKYRYKLDITSISDKLFVLFFVLMLSNVVIAFFNGVSPTDWIREYVLWTLMLYYFPIKEYFKEVHSVNVLLFLFAVVILILDFKQFYSYFRLMKDITYAYQIGTSIRINQELYAASIITSVALFFYSNTKRAKALALVVAMVTIGALISTFSRGFWLSVMLCLLLLLYFLSAKQIVQFFAIVVLGVGIMFGTISIAFPKQADAMVEYIAQRFTSSSKVKTDKSMNSRYLEWAEVAKEIKESPIVGHGLRKKFSFYNNITRATGTTAWIHNSYLNFSHKAGIPLAIVFHLAIVLFCIRGALLSYRMKKLNMHLQKAVALPSNVSASDIASFRIFTALAIGATLTLLMLLITSYTTTSMILRAGLFSVAFSIAFVHISEREYKRMLDKMPANEILVEEKTTAV